MREPVCRLRLALYGHPLSGLFWERKCQQALLRQHWEPIPGWECCYIHRKLGLVLSVYVDDFKLAGWKTNIAPTWAQLRKYINLDPPVSLDGDVYLGCGQNNISPPQSIIKEKHDLYAKTFAPSAGGDSKLNLDNSCV